MDSTTLLEAIAHAARYAPERGIGVYDRRGRNVERRTYAELAELAKDRAARLAGAGVRPGDRVLCALPTSWELFETFFGAVMLGAHPVMVAPPGALGSAETYGVKIDQLVELLAPKLFVSELNVCEKFLEGAQARACATAALTPIQLAACAPAAAGCSAQPQDIAFMQLTSGSTGRQRAVQVTHASAMHNSRAIAVLFDGKSHDLIISWLPLNHDMGLVGCLIYSLVHGLDLWMLRPETFLARPSTWLKIIHARRGTIIPGPNFAWQLCVDRIDSSELAGLDLSSVTSAFTGSEMIHPETCAAFEAKFGPFGFRAPQWMPCYGMAECTLAATGDRVRTGIRTRKLPERGDTAGMALASDVVCTGSPVMDTEVRISSSAAPGQFLPNETIGEVWIKGPGIFAGYFNDPQASAAALSDGWLRSGDLGFLKDGELYITGRLKDLLIIHGTNWMPHELEWEAELAVGGGGAERSGAFSIVSGPEGEKPVLVLECASAEARPVSEIEHAIRSRIGRVLGLPLADVVLVKRGQIPKTTSGKVQRSELRRRYIEGKLERLG